MSTTRVNENAPKDDSEEIKHSQPSKKTVNQEELDVQSTSRGITDPFVEIETSLEQKTGSLSSLDELAERLFREKGDIEDNDSFVTVEGCRKDITTATEPAIIFSINERTQNILTTRNEPSNYPPPPPYEYNASPNYQGRLGQTPVYQERYVGHPPAPQDASRAPPYRRNYEELEEVVDAFDTKRIRNKFIQKVYIILFVQLLFTFGFIALCLFEKRVKIFVLTHRVFFYLAIGIYCVMVIVLFCYDQTRRIFPMNFILLSLLTAAMTYMMAVISCLYSTYTVLLTFGVSAGVCLIVSLVACQTWFDVTECGMVLCLASLIVMVYGIIAMFVTLFTQSNITFIIYACLMTLLFCMYLMYDTQQILGGRRIELSPEEYILGAVTLYIDFMMIFQNLLYLFGALSGNG